MELDQLEDQNLVNYDPQNEQVEKIPAPFLDVKPNADYKFNAEIKSLANKTIVVNENDDFNEAEDKKPNFLF